MAALSLRRSLVVAFALLSASACSSPPPPTLPAPDPSLHPVALPSIEALLQQPAGVYAASAYVIDASTCPPCLGPDPCAPCDAPRIKLSSRPPSKDDAPTIALDPAGRGLEAFERGKRYMFTARVEPRDSGEPYLILLGASAER
jgi:hypothetical protein